MLEAHHPTYSELFDRARQHELYVELVVKDRQAVELRLSSGLSVDLYGIADIPRAAVILFSRLVKETSK